MAFCHPIPLFYLGFLPPSQSSLPRLASIMSVPDEHHPAQNVNSSNTLTPALRDSKGWDGKLRVEKRSAVLAGAESEAEQSDNEEDEGFPGEEIDADEGRKLSNGGYWYEALTVTTTTDLLDDYEFDTDVSSWPR